MNHSLGLVDNPQQTITRLLTGTPCCLTFDFDYHQSWLESQSPMRLTVVCLLADPDIRCVVVPQCDLTLVKGEITDAFEEVTNRLGLIPVHLNRPWQLQSLRIAKPWGAEIWYTGIEARGVCTVNNMPLPWLIAVSPRHTLGNCTDPNPILLKILDPHSEPEFGDLYFELHELKTEVYVVTHVDKTAWPDGHGQIRYGFNQARRAEFESIDVFKSTYLEAVNDYQEARDEIDQLLDEKKAELGFGLSDVIEPALLSEWLSTLPEQTRLRESELKQAMYAFTELRSIDVGDVIQVTPLLPHSLQHGVRVVEFQTAHYERHILSFTQKVLTQNHWDTETALAQAIVEVPEAGALNTVYRSKGCLVECVADFPQFTALRIELEQHTSYTHAANNYVLAMLITGSATVSECSLTPEQALFIPASNENISIETTDKSAVLLLAEPTQID